MEITSKDTQEDGYVKSVVTLKKEFNLSEKKIEGYGVGAYNSYKEKDIKEFIKRRIDDLHDVNNGSLKLAETLGKLKLEAGDDLI
jgi:hypothetical protein